MIAKLVDYLSVFAKYSVVVDDKSIIYHVGQSSASAIQTDLCNLWLGSTSTFSFSARRLDLCL
jgi:hypothetical protein